MQGERSGHAFGQRAIDRFACARYPGRYCSAFAQDGSSSGLPPNDVDQREAAGAEDQDGLGQASCSCEAVALPGLLCRAGCSDTRWMRCLCDWLWARCIDPGCMLSAGEPVPRLLIGHAGAMCSEGWPWRWLSRIVLGLTARTIHSTHCAIRLRVGCISAPLRRMSCCPEGVSPRCPGLRGLPSGLHVSAFWQRHGVAQGLPRA